MESQRINNHSTHDFTSEVMLDFKFSLGLDSPKSFIGSHIEIKNFTEYKL